MWLRVVGLISGTSADGVDVAVADLAVEGGVVVLRPVDSWEVPYPPALRLALTGALPPNGCSARQLCRLDTEVGRAFAAAAAAVPEAGLVSSLGQTLYHWVDDGRVRGTLQVGEPAWIAEATGLPVVSGLRVRDVAAGGQGAPLAPVLDRLLLGRPPVPTAALNLGGIANVTVVAPDGSSTGFDTGPANALLDAAAAVFLGRDMDVDGAAAARGRVHVGLLDLLRADPYYGAPPPKSTGKEHFNRAYLDRALDRFPDIPADDVLATLVALTATTVADACRASSVRRVVVSGGGVRNPVLMAALRTALGAVAVEESDGLGLPTATKEAYLAALLGFLAWNGVAVDPGTGAAGPRVHGAFTPGAGPLRLPEPVAGPVTGLRVEPAGPGGARRAHP